MPDAPGATGSPSFTWNVALLAGLVLVASSVSALAQRPLGIDVSHWDGTITWPSVKASGIAFAWAKATESTNITDTTFLYNEANAKAAGVLIGAYHFARYNDNFGTAGADAEAAYFWNAAKNYVKGGGYYLMPMLDVEVGPSGYTKTTLSQWINRWCQDIVNYAAASNATVHPVIYTSISMASTWMDGTVTQWPLWMAWPSTLDPQTSGPYSTTPWSTWNVWQYSWTGSVPGVPSACDLDVFNGTQSGLVSTLVIGGTVVTSTPPVIAGLGIFDLGAAGTNDLSNTHGVRLSCKVDVSKDGALVGATDGSTNAFIWTPGSGKVSLGSGMSLAGVDWLSGQVLAVINTNGGFYPSRWLGNANGTGGAWASLPAANGAAGSDGYWKATSLGVAADNSNWWIGGYTSGGTQNSMLRYKHSSVSATSIPLPTSGHANSYFFASSDEGSFAGTAEYGGAGTPGSGSVNGQRRRSSSLWLGPPEAGDGTAVSTSYTCAAEAISGDGNVAGGVDRNGTLRRALYWDTGGYVGQVPQLLISGNTYADRMEVHCLNKDGTVMGGIYYTNPPTDSDYEAFVYFLNSNAVVKVSDLLAASGASTNGWTYKDVTALSDDGNTLVGWGITNGEKHAWIALRLTVGSVAVTNVTCNGSANGSITVAAFGGGSLQYSKDNGATWQANNPTFTGLASGSYTVKVRDASGYTASYSNNPVAITQPTAVTISTVTPNNVTCNGGNNGSITVTASGGTGLLQYSKDNGASWQTNNPTFTGLTSGSYTIKVRDANLCTANYSSNPVTLSQPTVLTASAAPDTSICLGQACSLGGSASGGNGGYDYSWSPGTGLNSTNIPNPTASPTNTTLFTLTVTDSLGCTAQTQVNVTVVLPPTLSVTLSGADLLVSWPALDAYAGFSLEENGDLSTTNWTAVTNTPANDGTTKAVTLPPSYSNRFYRLRQ